jgi:hypothetical protein
MELSDILAFTLTCKACGLSVSVPTAERQARGMLKENRLDKCPACDEAWLTSPNGTTLTLSFDQMRSSLETMTLAMKERALSKGGFTLALEISSDPASSATD